jgi:sporulation integral membrane protein YtvI
MGLSTAPVLSVKLVWILLPILLFLIIYYLINIGNRYVAPRKAIHYNTKLILWGIITLFALYFVVQIFRKYTLISDTFFTILVSMLLAYLLNPSVTYFERKGMKRILAASIVYLIILGGIVILFLAVLPRTGREIMRLGANLPQYLTSVTNWFQNLYSSYSDTFGEMPEILQSIENVVSQNIDRIQQSLANGAEKFILGLAGMLSRIVSLVLTPVLTFYFLVDKDHFQKKVDVLIPSRYKEEIYKLLSEMDDAMSQFIRGRLLMAVIVGITTTIFLFLMGIEFAIIIGFITGLADIIPYIGPFLGFLPAVVFAFISSPTKALWVGALFLLIQWMENNILGPKVLGKTTGMHPLTVLVSIITGGTIFGVMGMIVSVPAVNIGIILYRYIKDKVNKRLSDNSETGTN